MNEMPAFERTLLLLQAGVTVLLLWRLSAGGLTATHRWLSAYLAVVAAGSTALLLLRFNSNEYAYTWVAFEVLRWTLSAFVVREIAGMVLAHYRGLSILSRSTVLLVVLLCFAGALAVIWAGARGPEEPFPLLRAVLVFLQGMALTLGLCLLTLLGFVLWFPLPLSRNTHLYSFCFLVPLFATALAVGTRVYGGMAWHRTLSASSSLIYAVFFILWVWRVRPAAADAIRTPAIARDPEAERRLLQQLAALNQTLESRR